MFIMTVSTIKKVFPYPIQQVWNLMTSLDTYAWRSDISEIKVLDDQKLQERSLDGITTTFTITKKEPYRVYAFSIENKNMSGSWEGCLYDTDAGTQVIFTEEVRVKKFYMKPFIKGFLQKQQETYMQDLANALDKQG